MGVAEKRNAKLEIRQSCLSHFEFRFSNARVLAQCANLLAHVERHGATEKCRAERDVMHAEDRAQRQRRDPGELHDVSDGFLARAGRGRRTWCSAGRHDASFQEWEWNAPLFLYGGLQTRLV